MNVFLEGITSSIRCKHVVQLNLVDAQQLNDLVCTNKGKNVCAWIVQCSTHSKLNAAELEKSKCTNSMYLCSDIGV